MDEPKVGNLRAKPYKTAQQWEDVSVELSKERLVVHRRDLVYEDVMASFEMIEEQHITLQRDEESRLGIAISGGLDFKCPIKIYKIISGTPAEQCGKLQEQDVLLEVNETPMWGLDHDQAVEIIKHSGPEVRLHTGRLQPREIEDQVPVDEQWFTMAAVPLHMASVTQYQTGTSILRPNGFEVVSKDGKAVVCLQCHDDVPGELDDWLTSITRLIKEHNQLEVQNYNHHLDRDLQVVKMGWVYEQLPATVHGQVWRRKFLCLKEKQVQIFDTMPESVQEWERPESCYNLLEMTVQVIESHTMPDQRANTLALASGTGTKHIISCETKENIANWTTAIHQATIRTVQSTKKMSYSGKWKERQVWFVLDLDQGVLLCSKNDPTNVIWEKPFSYLRESSDDGHTKLKLKCAIRQSKLTETQDIELDDLHLAVCSLECFLATKVALLDPNFIKQYTDLVAY